MKRLLMTIGMLCIMVFLSCSKSVEGETSAWNRNKTQVNDLISLYPGLKSPLKEKLNKAETAWDNAQSISGEEQKIEAMAKANSILSTDFVGKLKNYDRDKKKLQDLIIDAQGAGNDKSDLAMAKSARNQAEDAMRNSENRLRQGANTVAAANTLLRQVDSDFDAATKNLKKVISKVKDKEKQAKKDKTDKEDKDNAVKEALTWKCGYCSKVNDSKLLECKGCGAGK